MTSKRHSRCFVLALAPMRPRRQGCRVPLATYCKILYVLKFTATSHGSPCDSTAFLYFTVDTTHKSLHCIVTSTE